MLKAEEQLTFLLRPTKVKQSKACRNVPMRSLEDTTTLHEEMTAETTVSAMVD